MLCFSLKFTLSNASPQPLVLAVSAPLVEFRTSVRCFLEKRRKGKDTSCFGVVVHSMAARCQPRTHTIDVEDLKALRVLYDALHHPSILDARRHFRYGLSPLLAKSPPSAITLIASPRCSRTVLTSSHFNPTQVFLAINHPPTTYTRLTTTVSHAFRVMNATDLQFLRFLGEGTSGKVYLVRDRISKASLALKVIPKKGRNDYSLNAVIKERNISAKLADSPWFVNMWAAWHDQLHFYIAMTVYPTDLDSEIIRCGVIDPIRARFYMAEIVIALTELHSRGIIHRDIKAPNILIDQEGHIVLADFGLSKDFHKIPTIAERVYQPYWPYLSDENPTSESEPRDPEDLHFVAWNYRGSDMEMAPEIHLRMPYSFGVDFWSASVILYWMLTGRPPFYEDEAAYEDEGEEDCKPLMYKIAEDELYWDESDNVDDHTKDFLEQMMTKDPKQRLMISFDMPAHPYFAGVNWMLMEERLVAPPWIPGSMLGHVYEDISPPFVPGEAYLEDEDPFPNFSFYSKQLQSGVTLDDGDMDREEHSDAETVQVNGDDDNDDSYEIISRDELQVISENENNDQDCTSKNDCDSFDLTTTWDISIISPPATKPYGPGPKSWIHGLDLLKFRFATTHVHRAVEFPQRAFPLPTQTSSTTTNTTRPVSIPGLKTPLFTHSATTTSYQTTHVVNGVGFMFKIKVWMWKIWSPKPKPKRNDRWKRHSLLN